MLHCSAFLLIIRICRSPRPCYQQIVATHNLQNTFFFIFNILGEGEEAEDKLGYCLVNLLLDGKMR